MTNTKQTAGSLQQAIEMLREKYKQANVKRLTAPDTASENIMGDVRAFSLVADNDFEVAELPTSRNLDQFWEKGFEHVADDGAHLDCEPEEVAAMADVLAASYNALPGTLRAAEEMLELADERSPTESVYIETTVRKMLGPLLEHFNIEITDEVTG